MQTRTLNCDARILSRKPHLRKFSNRGKDQTRSIHGRGSHRALVVDDVPEICRLNSDLLKDLDFEVDMAEDGVAAWKLLGKNDYNLMITDNRMPRMSGVELLKKLYVNRRFVPTIMATGTMPDEQATSQPWFQGVTTLIKPYTLEELLAAVKRSIRKSTILHLPG
jgi:DNA-binding response OmpR family regulator